MLDLLRKPEAAAQLSTATGGSPLQESGAPTDTAAIAYAPLRKIADNPYQPRTQYDAEHILGLALSIKQLKAELPATRGLQQVPLARIGMLEPSGRIIPADQRMYANGTATRLLAKPNAMLELMFGHSRLRAFMLLAEGLRSLKDGSAIGLDLRGVSELETRFAELLDPDPDYAEMPLMLGFALDHQMWQHAITENSQRKNITAIEEAQSIQRAMDEFGLTTEQAGKPFGYARSTTANKLRLLDLPSEVKQAISKGELTERHGRELVRLADDPERLRKVAQLAVQKSMSVRQLSESVNWDEKQMKEAQEKRRQLAVARTVLHNGWTIPGTATTVPVDRVVDLADYQISPFDATDSGHLALLERGQCGLACPCFVVAYSEWRGTKGIRVDPQQAPNVCLACTKSGDRWSKERALGELALSEEEREQQRQQTERRRRVEEANAAAQEHWQQWLKEQDRHALWNSIWFWKEAVGALWDVTACIKDAPDAQTACEQLLGVLYRNTRTYNNELEDRVHTVAGVDRLIARLTGVSTEYPAELGEETEDEDDE